MLASITPVGRLDPKRVLMARAVAPAAAAPSPTPRPQRPAAAYGRLIGPLAPETLSALIEAQEHLA